MIFRGLFLRLFEMRFNRIAGILVPSISFAAIHLLNGEIDLPSKIMLLIGGTAVGVMFSLIALAGRSVWNSAIVHVLWDFFIIGIFSFTTTPGPSCLFAYHLTDTNIFITGGEFGIEPSLLSTIAYIIVAIVAYRELRQKQLWNHNKKMLWLVSALLFHATAFFIMIFKCPVRCSLCSG